MRQLPRSSLSDSFHLCGVPQTLDWQPGVNFINVLRAAFAHVDPKSVKRYWGFDWILTLLGSTHVKAVRRTLMKLSPGNISTFNAKFNADSFYKWTEISFTSGLPSTRSILNSLQKKEIATTEFTRWWNTGRKRVDQVFHNLLWITSWISNTGSRWDVDRLCLPKLGYLVFGIILKPTVFWGQLGQKLEPWTN